MASVKVNKDLGKVFARIVKTYGIKAAPVLKKMIINQIVLGVSPVAGYAKYKQYSESYLNAIGAGRYSRWSKKETPVNLTLSGRMLRSIKARPLKKGGFTLWFSDEKAKYHNDEGAGKARTIRKMLPGQGEFFSDVINLKLEEQLVIAVKKNLL